MHQVRTAITAIGLMALVFAVTPRPARAQAPHVPAGATVFIQPADNGMDVALAAALRKKKVPVVVMSDQEKADYVIKVIGEYQKAGWAKTIMLGCGARGEANASMTVTRRDSGEVVFAYNVDKGSAARGLQSAAEACAKHLGNHIKGKE